MTILAYKGYQGSVTFEDGRLVIEVLHITDSLTSECDKASEAQAAFEDLIDDYIETCAEIGKEPSKAFKGSFNVRTGPDLHRRAAMAASAKGETLNAWVCEALEKRICGEEEEKRGLSSSSKAPEARA